MLVLSRKSMERIQIGENVVITVLEIRSNKVRIGIEAPKGIHVLRSELQNIIAEGPADFPPAAVALIGS
jgi:carbon storage regulator